MNDYDSDYNSDSDSVASENQPLEINILQATCRRVQNTELFPQVKSNQTRAAHHRNFDKQ